MEFSGERSFVAAADPIEKAESFSPAREQQTNHASLDAENIGMGSELKKIPHGISLKHNSRKSYSPIRSNAAPFVRAPLTCSRTDIVNLQNMSPLRATKLNLSPDRTVAGENMGDFINQNQLKRSSAGFDTSESKKTHIEEPETLDDDFMAEAAMSPIKFDSKLDVTVEFREKLEIELLQTPSRPTEAVAVSPSSDQHTRILEEESMVKDVKTSPLDKVSRCSNEGFEQSSDESEEQSEDEEFGDVLHSTANRSVEDALRMAESDDEETDMNENNANVNEADEIKPVLGYTRFESPNELWESINATEEINLEALPDLSRDMVSKSFIEEIRSNFMTELNNLEESSRKNAHELQEAQVHIKSLDDDIAALELQKQELREKNSSYLIQIGVIEAKVSALETSYTSERHTNAKLEKQLDTYKRRYQQVFAAFKDTTDVHNGVVDKLDATLKQKDDLLEQVASLEKALGSVSDNLRSLQEQHAELSKAEQSLRADLDISNAQQLQAQAEQQLAEKSLQETREQLSAKVEELVLVEKDHALIEKTLHHTEEQLEVTNSEIAKLYEVNREQLTTIEYQETEAARLTSLLDASSSSKAALEQEIDSLKQTVEKLQNEKDSSSNSIIETLSAKIEKYEVERFSLEETCLDLGKKLEEVEEEKIQLQNSVEELKNQLEEANSSKTNLDSAYSALLSEQEANQEASTSLSLEVKNLKGVVSEQAKSITSLNVEINTLKNQALDHETELESSLEALAQDLYVQYSEKHEKKVEILRKGYETKWSGKLKKSEQENEKLQNAIESLKKQLATEKAEKETLMKVYEECMDQKDA
ncbi:unnamed protein product [Kuraishia capsulata CBS 1993]|uniref:Uncharacterized protein n=1 Tax=Kuraishia capsulata CBS 1993 TaxID=1382522 RepID=W6MF32_9ASCO|nr:uncharacterized protein KUCA_T00000144001 [Kuraishia capsulata CBS 1993]CDK24184.1 unnamed protein product [Kuraishia capsulata CBS 1993]